MGSPQCAAGASPQELGGFLADRHYRACVQSVMFATSIPARLFGETEVRDPTSTPMPERKRNVNKWDFVPLRLPSGIARRHTDEAGP